MSEADDLGKQMFGDFLSEYQKGEEAELWWGHLLKELESGSTVLIVSPDGTEQQLTLATVKEWREEHVDLVVDMFMPKAGKKT